MIDRKLKRTSPPASRRAFLVIHLSIIRRFFGPLRPPHRLRRLRGPIGIGGGLTTAPLPHHRAYGSRTTAVRLGKLAYANRTFRSISQSASVTLKRGWPQSSCRPTGHSRLALLVHHTVRAFEHTVSWLQVEAPRTSRFPCSVVNAHPYFRN